MSPRIMPAIGPATACPISMTLMPASGPFIAFSPETFGASVLMPALECKPRCHALTPPVDAEISPVI
jgi:hypothetical protein